MYALEDYLGEEKLNHAIAEYLRSVAYQDPPYTNSLELIEQIRRVTPPELLYLIEDLFETITRCMMESGGSGDIPQNGSAPDRYEVRLSVAVKKLRADDQGVETELFHGWPTSSTFWRFGRQGRPVGLGEEAFRRFSRRFYSRSQSHPRQGRHRSAEQAHRSQA